jgi:hypothetical protein
MKMKDPHYRVTLIPTILNEITAETWLSPPRTYVNSSTGRLLFSFADLAKLACMLPHVRGLVVGI